MHFHLQSGWPVPWVGSGGKKNSHVILGSRPSYFGHPGKPEAEDGKSLKPEPGTLERVASKMYIKLEIRQTHLREVLGIVDRLLVRYRGFCPANGEMSKAAKKENVVKQN